MNTLDTERMLEKLIIDRSTRIRPNVYEFSIYLIRGLQAVRAPNEPLAAVPHFPRTLVRVSLEGSEPIAEILNNYDTGLTEAHYIAKAIQHAQAEKEHLDSLPISV